MTKLQLRIARLNERRRDKATGRVQLVRNDLSKSMDTAKAVDAVNYIHESMDAVEKSYTQKTYEECDRIQNQLEKSSVSKNIEVCFKHQGSVTNNTHIKLYSDIDLLILTEKFFSLQPPLTPSSPYKGNSIEDLLELRDLVETTLKEAFPQATVDCSSPKAVSIEGGSLARKIDVIPSNWLETHEYQAQQLEYLKGIRIINKTTKERIANFPFLHNKRLEERNDITQQKLLPLIRLIKSIRADADTKIDVSSYNIVGLCYNMPKEYFANATSGIALLDKFIDFVLLALKDTDFKDTLYVPNNTRKLFDSSLDAVELLKLNAECIDLVTIAKGG